MKKLIYFFILSLCGFGLQAQNAEEAKTLISEGIQLHDKGEYENALAKYDKALLLDTNNLTALAEKAMTLSAMRKYDEAIEYCQRTITKHPGKENLKFVYVTLANSYDLKGEPEKALKVYDEGMLQFPNFSQLPFNKGVTLTSLKRYDQALLCFQKSASISPAHAGTHSGMARALHNYNKKIPALLAYCRFMILEPESRRAEENLANIRRLLAGNVEQTGKKSITINLDASTLGDTTADGKPKENSFTSTELILSLQAALDMSKENKKKTEVEKFIGKMETVCASLKETRKDNYGFYWDYYVPYFVEMKEKNYLKPFAYLVFYTSEDPSVAKWIKDNKGLITEFLIWSKGYTWKTK